MVKAHEVFHSVNSAIWRNARGPENAIPRWGAFNLTPLPMDETTCGDTAGVTRGACAVKTRSRPAERRVVNYSDPHPRSKVGYHFLHLN
jgi:hypothetical protein